MALPEESILQQADALTEQRNPQFVTEDLPSPAGFEERQIAPIPIPGTGQTGESSNDGNGAYLNKFKASILGTEDNLSPGKLPSYSVSEVFNPRYSSVLPGEDSEEAFALEQPWFKKWGNALVKFGANVGGTFINGMAAIPDTIASIGGGTPYDTTAGNAIDKWLKNLENSFPNYYTKWEEEHPFMSAIPFSGGFANFWGDKFLKNLGFAVGAIGSAVATDIAVGAVTEGIGAIPLIGAQVGRAALWLNKIFTGTNRVERLMSLGASAGRTGEQLLTLQGLARQAAATEVLNGTRFAINLYGASAAEAGFEARDAYNTVRQELIEAYQRENGYSPTGQELSNIESYARAAGNTRFGINLALLSLSNAIQFDTFLKPFSAARAGYKGIVEAEIQGGKTLRLVDGRFEEVVPKSIGGKLWNRVRPFAPSILAEGVYEEGGQYAAEIGTENYYERKFLYDKGISTKQYAADQTPWDARDQVANVVHSVVEGLGAQFGTDQGLENMLLGAITGAAFGGVTRWINKENNQQFKQTVLNQLNSKGVTDFLRNNYSTAAKSQRISEDMKRAAENNDIFKYKNFQHEQFAEFIISGLKADRFDVRMDQLDLLSQMNDDDFKKAFGLDKTTENVGTVTQYIDTLRVKAQDIKKSYDAINRTFSNPFVRNRKNVSLEEQSEENEKYFAFEDWKAELTYLSSIISDVDTRRESIKKDVAVVNPAIGLHQLANLTDRKYLSALVTNMEAEMNSLQENISALGKDADTSTDKARLSSLKSKVKSISSALSDEDLSSKKFEELFSNLLNYFSNGEIDPESPIISPESIPQLIEFGKDANRLSALRRSAYDAFDKLSTEEGFNRYYNQSKAAQNKAADKEERKSSSGSQVVEAEIIPTVQVVVPGGEIKLYEQGKEYAVQMPGDTNPSSVKIVNQLPEGGVVVEKGDGSTTIVSATVLSGEDALSSELSTYMAQEPIEDIPSTIEPTTKEGEFKKDLAFGTYSTTDPTYSNKTTGDNLYHRRHQNFLYNMGSSNPSIFNQDNKPRLRIIPITAKTQTLFGFPENWIGDSGQDVDNSTIRAVYVIDDRQDEVEEEKQRKEIVRAVQKDAGISDIIKNSFKTNPELAIDELYHQYNSGEKTRDELILSIGEDIIDLILSYKQGGIFFVTENGEKSSRIGDSTDPNHIIYSTFATTDLQFGEEESKEDRYTNKEKLDPERVKDWWKAQRARMLSVTTIDDTPMFQFDVSRGIPNTINKNTKNSVLQVGLIEEKDLTKPIITIATQGNVAILGAFNEDGAGIGAHKTGVKMPLGTPLLNFGGNLIFLNNRNLTSDEAINIFDLLRVLSDRSSTENKSAIFKYLNKIVYLANRDKATASSLTIEGPSLYLGRSNQPILMSPESIDARRDEILSFLMSPEFFHAVRNQELLRIAKNPKADDLQFVELGVEDGKVVQKRVWMNYNQYLLSHKDNEGKLRGIPPLTTNIAIPQAGEVPIVQKYSVLRNVDFDTTMFQAPATPQPAPPQPVVEQRRKEQGISVLPDDIEFVQVDLGGTLGLTKLGFKVTSRDASGNITDILPLGRILEDNEIVPFKNPEAVKGIIMEDLQRSQIKPKQDDDFWDDPDLKKGPDTQYRLFVPANNNYERANLEKEFQEIRDILPDFIQFRKLDHLIRTTSGGLAWGALRDSMIYIYENAEVGTAYHEAFEAVWQHFLTSHEQQSIYDEFTSRKGEFTTYRGKKKSFSDATVREAKEQIAEEFRDYKLSNKLPEYPRQRSFFRRLLDFIKKIIFGSSSDVNRLFKKINKGYYRNYSTSLRNPTDRPSYREIGLENFSEAIIQDTLQGMTAELFSDLFREGSSIIVQLEENPEIAARGIYGRLRDRLEHYFENTKGSDTLAAEMKARRDSLTSEDDKEAIKDQYKSIVDTWQKIKANWGAFVKEHERYLRVFNVEFTIDDEGNLTFEDEGVDSDENRNMVEYARDIFTMDAKNNASSKVKLLIATIADSTWRRPTEAAIGATRASETVIKRENSLVTLPKLAPYAKLFNYLLHNVSNINGIYEIWTKLKANIGNTELRKTIDANVQRLMNRLSFDNGFEAKTVDQAKLILSLENALSKQKPAFFRQFTDYLRNTYFKTSVTNSKIDILKASWIAGIKGSNAVLPSPNNQFIFSPSVTGVKDPIQFLNRLGIDISRQDYAKLRGKSVSAFNKAVNEIQSVVERAASKKTPIPVISSRQLDFDSRLNELANIYVTYIVGDDTQSQHPNLDNEPTSNFVLNNFVSTILSDANNSATREEFIDRIDNQYFKDIFHEDSILLTKILFDENGNFNKHVEVGVVEGRETWDQSNRATSRLTEAERQLYEINNNLNGVFYTLLPADAKTEWAINVGTYYSVSNFFGDDTSRGNEITRFANQMYKWLQTEIALAKDYDNRKDIEALNRKLGDRKVGNSLRFFNDILPKDIVEKIHTQVIDGGAELSDILTQQDTRALMREFIEKKAEATLRNLLDWNVVAISAGNQYKLNGFDKAFLDNHIAKKQFFSTSEVNNILMFREMNYITNNIEMHKFFFGDPAQYKDELKRIKSFLSGREITHVDTIQTSQGFNQWANINLNQVSGIPLSPTDPGYHEHKNHANTLTIYDVEFESDSIDEIKEVIGDRAAPYERGNEDDAGAYITASSYREVMYKAGGRFTAAQEKQFQWEMAWERQDKQKDGKYTYSSKELERADKELLKEPADENVAYPILKLVHSGIQFKDGKAIASLDKASWAPLFYRWFKDRKLGDLYNEMQKYGVDYVRLESAHKVGIQRSGSLRLYNEMGGVNSEAFAKASVEAIPFKQFGIQVEQAKKDKGQTEGSQLRKIAIGDLRSNGVPIDFIARYSSEEEAFTAWTNLDEEDRIKESPIYQRIKRHDKALRDLTNVRTDATMRRLGIITGEDGLPFIPDKKRVSDFILSELERRELPRNIASGLEVIIDPVSGNAEFSQPLEANAQYTKIRNILYSVMEKTVMRPKVNGGQKTLLSVTGMEKGNRIIKREVNGKPVYTSNELKFYKRNESGTEACEVMLPYWFGKKLQEGGSTRTKEEVIKYLNKTEEGRKLLMGIGFRIPTQGLNSVDFFVVKDFLPEQMGDVIVLPSEITVKAGSDFDIDKLNTYLRNFYVNAKTGYPVPLFYQGSEESTKEYLDKIISSGLIVPTQWRGDLAEFIEQAQADMEPDHLFMKIPGVAEMFSEEQLTNEYLTNTGKKAVLLDMYYQKTLENEYFDAIEALLSLPENYGRLITPNDASELKSLRNKMKSLKGIEEASLGEYGKLLDSNFMMKERQAYMSSKQVVGVSAVSQTAHAVAQNLDGGMVLVQSGAFPRFPHNRVNNRVSLSGLYISGTQQLISNINSQTTDGGVDVAKDKFLAEMGINQDTLATFLTLVRMGATPWWAILYLNQPAIQEFLKVKAIHSSVSQINPAIKSRPDFELLERVYSKFGGIGKAKNRISNKPNTYSIKSMEEMIEAYAKGKPLNDAQQILQLMMLDDYLRWDRPARRYEGYNSLSWDIFHYYQGYNWDTARLNDPNVIRLKGLKYMRSNNLTVSPASAVMTDTFIGTMKSAVERLDAGLRSLINVQVGAAGSILDDIAVDIFNTGGLNEEDRKTILLSSELAMVDFSVQTNANIKGRSLNAYIFPLLLGEKPTAKYIRAIQASTDKRLANNEFIKNLIVNIDNRQGYPSTIQLAERDYDTYTSNVWTDAFKELKEDATVISINNNQEDDRSVSQIYNNLVLTAIIQSGSKRSSGSMSHLIPNESYSQFTRDALRNMQLQGFYENMVVYRTNWNNNKLIPSADLEFPEGSELNPEMIGDYPFIQEGVFMQNLREIMSVDRAPGILHPIAWKFRKYKAIKIVETVRDPGTTQIVHQRVRLFARVDVLGPDGPVPLAYTKNRIIFKEINAWGDTNRIQEYYATAAQSVLPYNVKVNEATDDQILYALYKAGVKTNAAADTLEGVIRNFENDDQQDTNNDGESAPTPPDDVYLQVDNFEVFKNQLSRRNC